MKLTLHNYRRCPFCIRTRIVLYLKKIPYEIIEEPLRVWTDWMIENVEDKRVPVLRVLEGENENIMQESNDINLFLDSNFGKVEYTPKQNSEEHREMKEWWNWCSDELKPMIDTYKYGSNLQFDSEKNIKDTEDLHKLLEKIEAHLDENSHLVGGRLTLADIAIIPFVRQIMRTRNGAFSFEKLPRTRGWTESIIETDWFKGEVMKKVPLSTVDLEKRKN